MTTSVTPSHHPIYGVRMAETTIKQVIAAFPGARLDAVIPLERGKSYNNRIYFLKLSKVGECSFFTDGTETCDLVLKVNGRFFGADKIQNEAGFLRVLQHFCPNIPTPRVLAWSENGDDMITSMPIGNEARETPLSLDKSDADYQHGGWILMSRVEGTSISDANLGDDDMKRIMIELADTVANWRTSIPPQKYVGSLRFQKPDTLDQPDIVIGEPGTPSYLGVLVRGILIDGIKISHPIQDPSEYHQIKIREKMKELQTSDTYARNRMLVPVLGTFLSETLPQLHIVGNTKEDKDTSTGRYVFTHYDLSPRNVLVSGSPPHISGIVDFEFSGFYSVLEEFINDYGNNVDDWRKEHYNIYLERLEEKGISTPQKSIDEVTWKKAHCMDRLLDNIAPWWLPGDKTGDALDEALRQAEVTVRENIATLQELVNK